MPPPVGRMSWTELQGELERLRQRGDLDFTSVLRELQIYQEETERQSRELAQANRVIEESRDRYLDLFESLPVGYLSLSPKGIIEEVNPACAELLGRRREVLVGVSLFGFVSNGDILASHLRRLAGRADPVRDEVWLRRANGMSLPVELFSRSSRAQRVYRTAVMDLSDRMRDEEIRRELAIRARTAVEAGHAKDRFIAMLSHELRTPLTPILASIAALQEGDRVPPELRPVLERMRRNAEAEAHLIDDLLDMTRVRQGRMQVDRQLVDAHAVVREALPALGLESERVRLFLEARDAALWADAVRLGQIVTNLLRNALRATRDEGDVRLETDNPSEGTLRLTVRDTGAGIDSGDLERIFSAFESVGAPGAPGSGLGLGLAISKTLVEAHEGRIHAESEGRGKGSCFTVELPLAEPGRALHAGEPARELVAEPRDREAPPRQVLLVDDHEDSAVSLAMLLEMNGFAVRTARSRSDALERARGGYDVLVSDLSLPDGTGHELLQQLRERDGDVAAIAVSGFGTPDDIAASLGSGFSAHLTKPVDTAELVRAIKRALAA